MAKIKEPATKFTVMYTDQSAAGGSAPIDSNSPYEIGASVTVLGNTGNLVGNKGDNPTTDFICWSTNQNRHGNYYYPGQTFIIQENMTFYPVFRGKVEYYTINFEASAGGYIQGRTEFSAMPNTEFSLAVPSSEIPEAIANDGYEFDGWYIGDTYIGKTNEEITKYFNQVNSNIVISAHFKQKQVLGKNNYFAGFYVLKKGQSVDSTDKAYFFDVDKLYPSKVQGPANYEYVKYLNSGVLARSYEVSGRYLLHISNSIIKDPQEWNGEASSVSNHFVQSPSADQIQTALASNGFDSNSEVVWYRIVEAPEGWHVDGYVRDTSEDKVNVTFFVDNEVVMNSPVKKGEALSNDQIPVDPSKKDMKFVGWYTQDGIEFVENMTFNEDTVFYAGFSNQDEITISYVSENQSMGVVSPTSESLLPESGIAKGSTATANAGYRFVNWTYKGNAVSQNTKLDRNTIDQYAKENGSYIDATFVANFEKDPNQWVTVTFLPGEHGTLEGADAEGKVQTVDLLKGYDSYPSAPTVNAEEDWGFKGWDKEVATGEIPMEATDETYTAQYFEDKNHSGKDDEDEKVTIIFRAGANGSLNTGDITIEDVLIGTHFGDAVKTIPTPIANNGYHFTAWNNPIPANEAEVVGDMEFVANFAANQTDPDPVNPGCPAGTEWNEEAQACLAPVVPPVPVPPGPGPVNPEPQPEEEIIVEPTTPEGGGEVTPTPAPEVEEIEEPEQPQVGHKGSWALINLIASLLGLLAALFLIFAKHSKEDDDEEDQNQTVAMNEEDPEQLKRKRIYKWISGLTAVISVIVFVLTENMRLPMVLVDKWTLLMVVFFLINAVTLYLGRKWHEDEDDEEQTQA